MTEPYPAPAADTQRAHLRYIRGIDGLRAISVLAVLVYHNYVVGGSSPGCLPGGFYGVEVCFVLIGYLITSLLLDQRTRTFHCAHTAAHAATRPSSKYAHQFIIRAASESGVQIDHLDLGECGEPAQHLLRTIAFERLLAALDELDHFAVHQIYARDDHAVTRTGMPCLSSSSLSWFTV